MLLTRVFIEPHQLHCDQNNHIIAHIHRHATTPISLEGWLLPLNPNLQRRAEICQLSELLSHPVFQHESITLSDAKPETKYLSLKLELHSCG